MTELTGILCQSDREYSSVRNERVERTFRAFLRPDLRVGQAGEDRSPGRAKRVHRQSLDAVRSPAAWKIFQAKGRRVANC
jgi:hypothetical protein